MRTVASSQTWRSPALVVVARVTHRCQVEVTDMDGNPTGRTHVLDRAKLWQIARENKRAETGPGWASYNEFEVEERAGEPPLEVTREYVLLLDVEPQSAAYYKLGRWQHPQYRPTYHLAAPPMPIVKNRIRLAKTGTLWQSFDGMPLDAVLEILRRP
jgi:hypothetical protein